MYLQLPLSAASGYVQCGEVGVYVIKDILIRAIILRPTGEDVKRGWR
jgi:hypothetical protein